jgi:hypothetical protein
MDKDNPAANIERMSLSELAALEADVIQPSHCRHERSTGANAHFR